MPAACRMAPSTTLTCHPRVRFAVLRPGAPPGLPVHPFSPCLISALGVPRILGALPRWHRRRAERHALCSDTPVHSGSGTATSLSDELGASILNSLRVLHRVVLEQSDRTRRSSGLTLAQALILGLVCERSRSVDELAHAALADIRSIRPVVEALRTARLVRRSTARGGSQIVVATAAGRSRRVRPGDLVEHELIDGLRSLPAHQLVHLDVGLRRWLEYLGCWTDDAPMFGENAPEHPQHDRRSPSPSRPR